MVNPTRHRAATSADCLDERLLGRRGVAGLDRGADALHDCAHVGADVPISGSALDRLAGSLFC